jgi:hypothetical protein
MIEFPAETPRDREMVDKFRRACENLKKIADRLRMKTGTPEMNSTNTGRDILPI